MNFTETQRKAIDQIEKLLNLAAKAGTPEEAASATAKAQELLAKHNLSSEALEDSTAKQSAKREKAMVEGGRYSFQRDLWKAVAELNFCHYWQRDEAMKDEKGRYLYSPGGRTKWRKMNCLVGRVVNVRATQAMAGYLEVTIERMAVKRIGDEGWLMSSKWAHDYRRGAFEAVIYKLKKARNEVLSKEEEQAAKAAGGALGTAITVAGYTSSEDDANYAFRFGEEALRAKKETAAWYARAEAAYTVWAAANPDKAAEKFEFEGVRPYVTRRGGWGGGRNRDIGMTAYGAGRKDGDKIGLDPQAGAPGQHKRLTGGKAIYL